MSECDYILMGTENYDGWKLEDLLGQLIKELHLKSAKIATDQSHEARMVLNNNASIINCLDAARDSQLNSQDILAAKGENQGPEGTPRIGEGSQ